MSITKDLTGGTGWDPEKKKKRDAEREVAKAKSLIGHIYQSWKVELCSKPRSRREVLHALYDLRDKVLKQAAYLRDNKLEDFSDFTYRIVSDKIAEVTTFHITGKNVIKQHVPVTLVAGGHVELAKVEDFRTKDDLLQIDFVKHFTEQPGFLSLSWHREDGPMTVDMYLLAHYASGDSWLVGTLINDVGLDDIPTHADFCASLPPEAGIVIDFNALRQAGSTAQSPKAGPTATDSTPPADPAGSSTTEAPTPQ